MGTRIRDHIRGNVVGYVSLFIALSGTAYAIDGPLAGQNTVGTLDIIRGEVRTSDLGPKAVSADKIDGGAVGSAAVENASLTGVDIRDDTVISSDVTGIWGPDVIPDGLTGADVTDLTGQDVSDESLTGADIDDESIDSDDVDDASLRGTDLRFSTISNREITDGAVQARELTSSVVRRAVAEIPGGEQENGRWVTRGVEVLCASNEDLISGGAGWGTELDNQALSIVESRPVDSGGTTPVPFGWHARGANDSGITRTFAVYAVCLN